MLKNTLSDSTSPYLLQHKDNPVHWQEWSDEVLELAKKENKCLLISVGYSACHWCHVMAHECFEDEQVAALMNEHFINIKIDREERPDIDQIYMDAAQILTGRGGWPLNAFALPDGKPFYAGTYFPKDNWIKVLKNIAQAYKEQPETIVNTANRLTDGINSLDMFEIEDDEQVFTENDLMASYQTWYKHIDFKEGGIDKAPKFPMPCVWQSLLEYYAVSKDSQALEAVEVTLDKMYHGGIYDWVVGGFARYSVDGVWFAPHFEKMLYDNAQLISLYADAYKVTQNASYKACVENTIDFLNTHLKDEKLGYYSALDADSEGEEGYYYTWTYDELQSILDTEEFELAERYFNFKTSGNWENQRNILAPTQSKSQLAESLNKEINTIENQLSNIKSKLSDTRQQRVKPGLDNKLITAHNAMMVKALVKAYQAFGLENYKVLALELMQSLMKSAVTKDFSLKRLMNKDNPQAFLDDYAFMVEALLSCYEISFEKSYLTNADSLIKYTLEHFSTEENNLFYYASKDSLLIARKIEFSDNVIPSSNAVMATNLWKLGHLLNKSEYINHAKEMLNNVQHLYKKYSMYFSTWHQLHLGILKGQIEVAVTGPDATVYAQELQKHYWPFTLFCGGTKEDLPQLAEKVKSDANQIFICQNQTCSKPTTNVKESLKMLKEHLN
jgi:uncharacterized protein YyaL (SSP411 family)